MSGSKARDRLTEPAPLERDSRQQIRWRIGQFVGRARTRTNPPAGATTRDQKRTDGESRPTDADGERSNRESLDDRDRDCTARHQGHKRRGVKRELDGERAERCRERNLRTQLSRLHRLPRDDTHWKERAERLASEPGPECVRKTKLDGRVDRPHPRDRSQHFAATREEKNRRKTPSDLAESRQNRRGADRSNRVNEEDASAHRRNQEHETPSGHRIDPSRTAGTSVESSIARSIWIHQCGWYEIVRGTSAN